MVEHTIQSGAAFEGRRVGDLGLPAGCLIVTVRRGTRTEVPHRDTLLEAGDRISAVVAPQGAGAVAMLREGTRS